MEVLKKQSEDLNTRLTAIEGRNSQRDQELEERRERERRERIRRGKQPLNLNQ